MKKILTLFCVLCLLSSNILFAIEDYNNYEDETVPPDKKVQKTYIKIEQIEKKDPGLIKLPNRKEIAKKIFEEKMANDDKEYKKHKNSLGNGYYMIYRIADKILRANNLDTQNWRFVISKNAKVINAYATAGNLVVLNSSIVDTFIDNEAGLAHVIGHEISHHILKHLQMAANSYHEINDINEGIQISTVNPYSFAIVYPIYTARKLFLHKKIRDAEYEADTEALTLMARAGYDVDYANDVILTLSQLPEITQKYYDDTHPKHYQRLRNVNNQIARLDIDSLKKEGAKNLIDKPVMKCQKSSDNKSLVLVPEKTRGTFSYSKLTPQQKNIYKAYNAYINDDLPKAEKLFTEAYKLNKKNYIPCLYLSYIYEYNYSKNQNKDTLKQAKKWANKAYKKNKTDKSALKQKMEVDTIYKML